MLNVDYTHTDTEYHHHVISDDAAQQAKKSCVPTPQREQRALPLKSKAHLAEAGAGPMWVCPLWWSQPGLCMRRAKSTSICLHDCLAFIALDEQLPSKAQAGKPAIALSS